MKKVKCNGCDKGVEKPLELNGRKYCRKCWEELQGLTHKKTANELELEKLKKSRLSINIFMALFGFMGILIITSIFLNQKILGDILLTIMWITLLGFNAKNIFTSKDFIHKQESKFISFITLIPMTLSIYNIGKKSNLIYIIGMLIYILVYSSFMYFMIMQTYEYRFKEYLNEKKADLLDNFIKEAKKKEANEKNKT